MATTVDDPHFQAAIDAAHAANAPVDVCSYIVGNKPKTRSEIEGMTKTLLMYYRGWYLWLYDEAGKETRTMTDYIKGARTMLKVHDRWGWSRAQQVAFYRACLDGLALEIHEAFGSEPYKMRDVRKLWRDDFVVKHEQWFAGASALLVLGAIRNDEHNGWLVHRSGEGIHPESAEQIFDTCSYCGITGSFKRCPCSKKVRYCGSACQNMHWGEHKAAHKAKLAKRARRARASAGLE